MPVWLHDRHHFVIVTHDPPDLREVARRVSTYLITALVIVTFYVAGFTATQTAFNALPNYSPLLVGAGIAMLLALIFTPLLYFVQRLVNRWLNVQEYHASKTLHAYSEQNSNILDMQRLANVAVGLIIEAMDITRGFLFLVDSETPPEGQKFYRLRAVRNEGERQIRLLSLTSDHPVVRQLTVEMRALPGFLPLIVPASRFRLLRGAGELTTYTFNTGAAKHLFCRHCGIKSFYVPRSNPDGYSVNARCLDRSTIEDVTIEPFDGRNWEQSAASLAHLSRE